MALLNRTQTTKLRTDSSEMQTTKNTNTNTNTEKRHTSKINTGIHLKHMENVKGMEITGNLHETGVFVGALIVTRRCPLLRNHFSFAFQKDKTPFFPLFESLGLPFYHREMGTGDIERNRRRRRNREAKRNVRPVGRGLFLWSSQARPRFCHV